MLLIVFHIDMKYIYNTWGLNQLHLEQFPTDRSLKGICHYGAKLCNDMFLNFADARQLHSYIQDTF